MNICHEFFFNFVSRFTHFNNFNHCKYYSIVTAKYEKKVHEFCSDIRERKEAEVKINLPVHEKYSLLKSFMSHKL